jgi:hypothetical protein
MHKRSLNVLVVVVVDPGGLNVMRKPECLKRAAECIRLAEAASDTEIKLYLMKLALSWMLAAAEAEHTVPEAA